MLSHKLHAELAKAAHKHYQLKPEEVELTLTRDLAHGDYTTNVALRIASKWGVPPKQASEILLHELQHSAEVQHLCSLVAVAGPGFINFTVKPEQLVAELPKLTSPANHAVMKGQRVIVEYSSPNIAKPMHIGHFRSTIIGQALGNVLEALGAKVLRINHLGDWGTQFGKLIAAYRHWGTRSAVAKRPIEELLRLYVKFHDELKLHPELEQEGQEEFLKLEHKNRENKALWTWFKQESLKEFNVMYKRLGVSFTYVTGESFYEPMLKGVVADLLKRKIAVKNEDGSIVVHLTVESLPPCLIQKSDGASLYATRDLAAVRYRSAHYHPRQILYVVGNEQALHFEQVFAVARRAGYSEGMSLRHVKNGLILGDDGQKLATREGKVIRLEEVLDEAVARARKILEAKNPKLGARAKAKIAEVVGIGAVKYNDLSQNRHTDITFNWDKILSLDGNSAPYLMYSYVRLKSILRKAGAGRGNRVPKLGAGALTVAQPADLAMLRTLSRYPSELWRASLELGPHLLAGYLFELANSVNSYYHTSPVLQASRELKPLRLALVTSAANVLVQGLGILGIAVVEAM